MINAKSLLLATCIAAVPGIALAQSATQAPANNAPAATTAPATSAPMASNSGAGSTQPLAMPSPNQIMGADLRGANVYTANNESIGDIKDIVMTRNGNVDAVIVGVGGFLGIGEKNVAIPFRAIDISDSRDGTMASTGAREPATTGSTATNTTSMNANTNAAATQGTIKPQRIVLRNMTKAELEAAPAFRADGGSSATGTSTTGGTMNNNRTTAPAAR